MFVGDLFESTGKNITVVYPGRFMPPHKGHKAVYDHLCQKYGGGNVYIVTSDKTDNLKSPFNFAEKRKMWTLMGVSSDKVIMSTQPYRAMEIVSKLDPSSVLMFAISEKDMAEDPRFQFAPKKDGSPSYFQPFKDIKQCKSLEHHAYMITVPTFEFTVLGEPANSASQIRAQFGNADEETKKKIVADLFGKFDPVVYNIMNNKLQPVPAVVGESTVTEASKHKKEVEAKRKKYEQEQAAKRDKEGETYHYGNAKVTKPPVNEISNDLSKNYMHGALHDTITGKKDRNPGISQAMNRISGTQYPLVPDTENPDPKIRSLAIAVEKMKDQLASLTGQPTTESTMKKVNELSSNTLGKYKKAASETLPKNMHQAGNRAQGVSKAKDKINDKEVTSKAKAVGHPMVQEADHGGVPWGPVAQKEYFENWHKWDQAVRYNGGTTEHAGDGIYRATGIDDGGIGEWDENANEGWLDLTGESNMVESVTKSKVAKRNKLTGGAKKRSAEDDKKSIAAQREKLDAEMLRSKKEKEAKMIGKKKSMNEAGRFVKGPGGVPLDRYGDPIPPKPPKAPARKKLTLDDVWRKVEEVVGNIFPDGDPIDWMLPWLERQGIEDYKCGDIIDRAARKNGYKDMYDYWNELKTGDYGHDFDESVEQCSDDGICMGASVYHREHQNGVPFKVIKIVDDQRVGVIDDFGNKKVMFIKQLVPATQGVTEGSAPWAANWKTAALASKKAQQSPSGANHKRAAELHKKGASDPWGPYKDKHEEAYAKHTKAAKVYGESAGQVNELSVGTMDSYRSKRVAQGNKNLRAPHPAGEKAEKGINRAYNKTMSKKASTPSDPTLDRSDDYSTWKKGQNESKRSLKAIVREMHEQARQGDLRAVASCVRELVPFKQKESLKEGIMANVNKALTVAKRNSR